MIPPMTLNCKEEEVMKVTEVMYGRDTTWFCEHETGNSTSCVSETAIATISNLCNGKNKCLLGLTHGLLGDPCPGVLKYLRVTYQCASKLSVNTMITSANTRSMCF